MNPSFIPFSYLNPDLGHHGPYVDGLLVARRIVEDSQLDDELRNSEKYRVLIRIDRRIEEAKIHWARNGGYRNT